jgi:GTPase SAR1 family protein
MFDVTKSDGLANLTKWYEEVNQYCDEFTKFLLVGNKVDLKNIIKLE